MQSLILDAIPDALHRLIHSKAASIQAALNTVPDVEPRWQKLPAQVHRELPRVLVGSDYVCDQATRYPAEFISLLASDRLWQALPRGTIQQALREQLSETDDEKSLARILRQFRREQMMRIIWRDLCRLADFTETTHDLTELADACIDVARRHLYGQLCRVYGTPCFPGTDRPMPLVVLGMGKLGAGELNLSSDIDLMFAYPVEGETQGVARPLTHREFFTRLGQKLIKSLDEFTADGFVFRVDMRLRPYGKAGALALSFDGMTSYYETQGREWERYAMIKARPIGDDAGAGKRLLDELRPFVYRRYVDFGVIESLRDMKAMINRDVLRREAQNNVKTGSGGIREVEFIAQAFQLIRGGQEPELQERRLLKVLDYLAAEGLLPGAVVTELRTAYVFLRDTEHRLQAMQDRQTQTLPDDIEQQARLACMMDFADWEAFLAELDQHRAKVRVHFENVIAVHPDDEALDPLSNQLASWVWHTDPDAEADQEHTDALLNLGFTDPARVWQLIAQFHQHKTVLHLQAIGRQRLDRLMPLLIAACGEQGKGELALERSLVLVEAILRRSAYMAMLVENPKSLAHMARLCAASPWVANILTRYPVLLDELLDAHSLYTPPPVETLKDELRQTLLRIPEDDAEQQMESLRQFKNAHLLRVAASDITGTLPVMKVSDYLTWTAETLLQGVLDMAWQQVSAKYGVPLDEQGQPCSERFIIVGYGKVGGIELSYSSDLDLVFIHNAPPSCMTDGERPVENAVFYARLGQRIIHILTTRTASGLLYDADMRLRPSGNSGLLVTTLKAFQQYQADKAWTWEHQALVRARTLAGDQVLQEAFEAVRAAVLTRPRDADVLRADVVEMRNKMMAHLSKSGTALSEEALQADALFDLKQAPGGIVDIEFLVQFIVLRWSGEHEQLTRYTDNMRILETAEQAGVITSEQASVLKEAYLAYRSVMHRLALQNQESTVPGDRFVDERRAVRGIWEAMLGE